MRKPLIIFLLLIISKFTSSTSSPECPLNLPKACVCEKLLEGFRVTCHDRPNFSEVMTAMTGSEVYKLDIRNCDSPIKELDALPAMKVKTLAIVNCGIEKVLENAFEKMATTLEDLRLINNSLTTIPLIGQLPKLEAINFDGNLLTEIPEKSFEGAPRLRHIRLRNNKICSLSINSLNEVKSNLELLDLSANCFTSIPAQNLRNSPKLSHLDLSENKIADLGKLSFMNLPSLKELRLNSNRLGSLSPLAFVNVPAISHLLVKNNFITKLEPGTLQVFKQLEVVDFSGNEISTIPSFKDMPKLKSVVLDGNKIRRIETMTFSANPALQAISIQNNEISLIAKNSFDSLDQLVVLMLGNNSLTSIEKGVFDGMRNLQQLSLIHNTLQELSNLSLGSLPKLNTADFSKNKISKIHRGAFDRQINLFWLDLSNNNISTIEEGTFGRRIANIIFDGNKLNCDEKFDWFVTYLVKNQVRTFIPAQPEIKCEAPKELAGVRLKDLMIKKANETMSQGTYGYGSNSGASAGNNFLGSLFPGFMNNNNNNNQNVPQRASINPNQGSQSQGTVVMPNGRQPNPNEIRQMLANLPSMMVNIPGFGNVDLSKIPTPVLEHVLRGGQIPGIPRETLTQVVQQYTQKMYGTAIRPQSASPIHPNDATHLHIANLPSDHVSLNRRVPINTPEAETVPSFPLSTQLNPQMFSLLSLLPPNYNFSKIPQEVIQQVMKGEMPDFSLLPHDIIEHLRVNSDKMFNAFKITPNTSLDEVLKKLPKFDPIQHTVTFTPYDINSIDSDLVIKEEGFLKPSRVKIFTVIALGLFGTISIIILSLFCFHLQKNRRIEAQRVVMEPDNFFDASLEFRPIKPSTHSRPHHDGFRHGNSRY